ncbi:MAG: acetyl-CoA carboxylase biotin carboxyl carrier protein [Gammaproteobacteria bacterium]|nr:acetyl-CoA carboxylase biotin carboxyl carrier protein [Gammaproteobacteria bacterium]
MVDIRKVRKLIELLDESDVSEIEITEGEEGVRVSRFPQNPPAITTVAAPSVTHGVAPAAVAPTAPAETPTPETTESALPEGHIIRAPMVGTYYSAPMPGAKAFSEIGMDITKGQTICIIEAMKMMNQIESDIDGKVSAMLVDNGDPVEFDQPLFVIEAN